MSENIERNLLVSLIFPVIVSEIDDGHKDRFLAEAIGTIGGSEWGKTEQEAVDALHQAIVTKLHRCHSIPTIDRITGTPPTAEEMMHMVESMLFDHHTVGGLMPSTLENARVMLLRAGGPQNWKPEQLGFKEPNGQ